MPLKNLHRIYDNIDGEINAMFITASEAITLKQLLENQFIHPEVVGGVEVVNKIIRFANEQLANRVS